ncbi:MAG: hypothetical protein RL173_1022 [Fibrobacterota bacterium]|jgi:hypothetical protein
MAIATNEIVLINAVWNDAVGAYIGKVDGKTAIITVTGSSKSAPVKVAPAAQAAVVAKPVVRRGKAAKKASAKTVEPAGEVPVSANKQAKAKDTKTKAKRQRSPSLSAAQEAEVLALNAAGKSLSEILAAIPGTTVGIVRRLKRVAAKAPKAKAKPAAKAAAKKTATKNAKAAPAA